jgi:hypothetical protein
MGFYNLEFFTNRFKNILDEYSINIWKKFKRYAWKKILRNSDLCLIVNIIFTVSNIGNIIVSAIGGRISMKFY